MNPQNFQIIHLNQNSPKASALLDWLVDAYFLGLKKEIQQTGLSNLRQVDLNQKSSIKRLFESFLENQTEAAIFLALDSQKNPQGYAFGALKENFGETPNILGVINGVYVQPKFRRHGLATLLYQKLKHWFYQQQVQLLELNIAHQNNAGIEFWQKQGFQLSEYQLLASQK